MSDSPPDLTLDTETRLKRLRFRASHRGIQEADIIIGGFVAQFGAEFSTEDMAFMESLLTEQDQDILNWLAGKEPVPEEYKHTLMSRMSKLDYISISK